MNRKAYAVILASALVFLAFGFLTGCGSSTPPPITIAATSGSGQSATVGTAFLNPLVATVMQGSSPASGVSVTFAAPSSGPSGTFANGTTSDTETTNSSGVATSSKFTANSTAGGPYVVGATASGARTLAGFSLTNTAGAAATITATGGTPQSATVGTAFGTALAATVVDSSGNPVSNASVTFQAPASGASGTFSNGTATDTEPTNSSGVATTSLTFTANTAAGTYTVTASVSGVATPANFALTNNAGAAATITATGGTPQSVAVNMAFAQPLSATVADSYSNPVSGASVTFQAPTSGASGTFTNGTATETDTTNTNGVATSTTFTANSTTGSYTVTGTVSGVSTPANFSLTNLAVYNYSFYLSGLETINPANGGVDIYALAGSVLMDSDGNVLAGEQDYNDGNGFTSPQPSGDAITGGTLRVNSTTGQGTLILNTNNTLLGVNGTETLGVQFVNANHALIIQFDSSATSSGSMDLQTLPSTPSGGFAFTLSGLDNRNSLDAPVVAGGVFTISGTSLSNGLVDINDNGTVTTGTAFTGTLSAPDNFGRGTITGTGIAGTINYYIVGPEAIRIIDVDTTDSGVGSAFGQGSTTFTDASLGRSVFTLLDSPWDGYYAAAGMFTTFPGGAFQGVADDDEFGSVVSASPISGTYSISPTIGGVTYNGYGSFNIASGSLESITKLGIYMTDPTLNLNDPNNPSGGGGALVLDLDAALFGSGVVIPQTDTKTSSFNNNYAFGAQEYNGVGFPGWEFDFVGQGSVSNLALSGSGLINDPFAFFSSSPANYSGVPFSGTATPDAANPGRYTIPLAVTAVSGSPVDFNVVIYQASGGQLFWLDTDNAVPNPSWFLGPLEQQGSLSGMPAVKKHAGKTQMKSKK